MHLMDPGEGRNGGKQGSSLTSIFLVWGKVPQTEVSTFHFISEGRQKKAANKELEQLIQNL